MSPISPGSSTADEVIHWRHEHLAPALTTTDLHLWRIDTAARTTVDPGDVGLLSIQERSRAERLVNASLRAEYTHVHARLRLILALYLKINPTKIRYHYAETGKPSLEDNPTRIEFNLSTVTGLSLLVVAKGRPMGIDCERIRPRDQLMGIARRMFPPTVAASLSMLPDDERLQAFYKSWTALEAEVKVDGRGLARRDQSTPLDVEIQHFTPAAGLIGAVACRRLPAVQQWRTLRLAEPDSEQPEPSSD